MIEDDLIYKALDVDSWPDWINEVVDQVCNDYVDEADMSMEQTIAYAIFLFAEKYMD